MMPPVWLLKSAKWPKAHIQRQSVAIALLSSIVFTFSIWSFAMLADIFRLSLICLSPWAWQHFASSQPLNHCHYYYCCCNKYSFSFGTIRRWHDARTYRTHTFTHTKWAACYSRVKFPSLLVPLIDLFLVCTTNSTKTICDRGNPEYPILHLIIACVSESTSINLISNTFYWAKNREFKSHLFVNPNLVYFGQISVWHIIDWIKWD